MSKSIIHEDAYAELFQDPAVTETFLYVYERETALDRLIELREEAALAAELHFEEPTIEEDACPFCHPHECDCAQRPAYLLQLIPVGQSGTIQGREVTREAMNTFFVSGFNIRVSAPTAAGLLAA